MSEPTKNSDVRTLAVRVSPDFHAQHGPSGSWRASTNDVRHVDTALLDYLPKTSSSSIVIAIWRS